MICTEAQMPRDDCMKVVVSVVLPVYNGEKYLAEAIESILAQTFTDFELIVIDDGSTDESLAILKKYERQDGRIKLIARGNRNLATTLNDCIEMAQGEWVARMDQDDIALPHRLETQLKWMQETGADICGSWVRFFGAVSGILRHAQTDSAIRMELLFGSPFAHPSVMMRTKLAKLLKYDKNWEKCEDYDLWERAARAGWKMGNIPEVLLLYRQHPSQISTITYVQQQRLGQEIRQRYWEYIFGSLGLEKKWVVEVLKLRDNPPGKPCMNDVDAAFAGLLRHCSGEAREVVFSYITRLYFRAAAGCPDVSSRWQKINAEFGSGRAMTTRLKLAILSKLHIQPGSLLFELTKKIQSFVGK